MKWLGKLFWWSKAIKLLVVLILFLMSCDEHPTSTTNGLKPHFSESEHDYYQADSLAGHIHQFNAKKEFAWEEHPKGRIELKTNNLGFKKDVTTSISKQEKVYRVLVTGDSHTDGVVYNSESFPNRLEKQLNLMDSVDMTFEFLNAGAGYYGPQNYLGVLKRNLYLKPDAFLIAIYTGNDFLDAVRIEAENNRLAVPHRGNDYYAPLWKVDKEFHGFTGQLMNQIKFFKTFPDFQKTALSIWKKNLQVIQRICEENQIKLYTALIPTKVDVEAHLDEDRINAVKEILELSDGDLVINRGLSQEIAGVLNEFDIPVVDFYQEWEDVQTEELYWKTDYHINHVGHQKMAEGLEFLFLQP